MKTLLMPTCIINSHCDILQPSKATFRASCICRVMYFMLLTKLNFTSGTHFVDLAVEMCLSLSLKIAEILTGETCGVTQC